jgi:hypothetical protein
VHLSFGARTSRGGIRSGGKTPAVAPLVHSPDLVPAPSQM